MPPLSGKAGNGAQWPHFQQPHSKGLEQPPQGDTGQKPPLAALLPQPEGQREGGGDSWKGGLPGGW